MKSLVILLAIFLISFPVFAQENPSDRYGEQEPEACNTLADNRNIDGRTEDGPKAPTGDGNDGA